MLASRGVWLVTSVFLIFCVFKIVPQTINDDLLSLGCDSKTCNRETTKLQANDFILGSTTNTSRLVHTERIIETTAGHASLSWTGQFSIVMIEGLDQTNGLGGFVFYVDGGLKQSHVNLFLAAEVGTEIDFIFNIHGDQLEPQDLVEGNLTEISILLHTERIVTNTSVGAVVGWSGPGAYRITRLEVFDQTNGLGGFIAWIDGGVNHRQVEIHFQSFGFGPDTDFIVNIYGDPVTSYDFVLGELTNTSIVVHTENVTGTHGNTLYWDGLYEISRVEALDQSNGTGGFVSWFNGGVSFRYLIIRFEPVDSMNGTIDFVLNILTEPLIQNDFIVGNKTGNSVLAHQERVSASNCLRFEWKGPYFITRIEAKDQGRGAGGKVSQIEGGLKQSEMIMYFESILWQGEIDFIIDIYGEQLK